MNFRRAAVAVPTPSQFKLYTQMQHVRYSLHEINEFKISVIRRQRRSRNRLIILSQRNWSLACTTRRCVLWCTFRIYMRLNRKILVTRRV